LQSNQNATFMLLVEKQYPFKLTCIRKDGNKIWPYKFYWLWYLCSTFKTLYLYLLLQVRKNF